MSMLGATVLAAIATAVLAIGAIVTAFLAYLAFRKQSQEVSAIERQVADEQHLTRQQAELIKVQTGQLEALQGQLEEQRKTSAAQGEVLDLQAAELRESLRQRERDAQAEQRSQAAKVSAWFGLEKPGGARWGAWIRNASDLPVTDVRTFFHYIAEKWPGGDWDPAMRGGPIEKVRVMPPMQDRFIEIPAQVRNMIKECDDSVYAVSVEFTDAAGGRWERDPRGALNPRS